MRNLFAYLVCIGVRMSETMLEEILAFQNPYRQRRGGFGYGIFATVMDQYGQFKPRALNVRINMSSPFHLFATLNKRWRYQVFDDRDLPVALISPFEPPGWMGRTLQNGRDVAEIIQQHTARNLVGVIGGTRCPLFDSGNPCSFCSMSGGDTNLSRSPAEIIEALGIILEYKQDYILTLTTSRMTNKEFKDVCDSLAEIKSAYPQIPLALESLPAPKSIARRIKSAGVDTWMLPLDCYSQEAQKKYVPGKRDLLGKRYWRSLEDAVALFGEGGVTCNLLVGLENIEFTKVAAARMVLMGAVPELLPIRPTDRLSLETDPNSFVSAQIYLREIMESSGLARRMSAVKSGCAACGGCSAGVSANAMRQMKDVEQPPKYIGNNANQSWAPSSE